MGESEIKILLRNLCVCNGWCYGVFWRFDQRNSMLLTIEDAYYEENMGMLIDNMLLQVHMLGEGAIGQAALTGKHRWVLSDSLENQDIFQDNLELQHQFSSGIKTIVVISMEPRGVVQFGSTQKILESFGFLDQTKRLFQEMQTGFAPLESTPSTLNNEPDDLSGLFDSLMSFGDFSMNLKPIHGDNCIEMMGRACSSVDLIDSSPFMAEFHHEGITPIFSDSSDFSEQLHMAEMDTQNTLSNDPKTQFPYSVNSSAVGTPCISTWSTDGSILTSCDPHFPSEISFQDSKEKSTNFRTFPEQFKPADFPTDLSKCYKIDNLTQWCAPLLDNSISRMTTPLKNDISPSSLFGVDTLIGIPVKHSASPALSSITNSFSSDGKERDLNVFGSKNDLFEGLGLEFGCGQVGECRDGIKMPVASSGCSTISAGISDLDVGSVAGPHKGLLSELGLEELLNGIGNSRSVAKSIFNEQLSSTKRRLDSSSMNSGSVNLVQPNVYNRDKTNNFVPKKEVLPKSQVGLWIDDSYSINTGTAAIPQPKKEEPTKATRKRARPGESTRPRPKDRQQIQDRIKELRGIVPNGHKSSIDSLLDRTIKYMLFLQSVANYADKLKQADEPKLIGQENGVVLKDNTRDCGGGATWAYELGGQTMVCPIIVEDLSPPGQMLIEMLCEDRGFFLEIADIIRGFGLNILKGVMELRENKIWARFIVEASKYVTRMDIFWSLVQLLQQTATSSMDLTNQSSNAIDSHGVLLNNHQQPSMPHPISLAETI